MARRSYSSPLPFSALLSLSVNDARVMALRAQGLLGSPYPMAGPAAVRAGAARRTAAVEVVLRHLGAVQLDTISVLARNHELVPYARLGAVGREAVEAAYWGNGRDRDHPGPVRSFEYWSHAACILPVQEWPWFAFRRRSYQRLGVRWHEVPRGALDVRLCGRSGESPGFRASRELVSACCVSDACWLRVSIPVQAFLSSGTGGAT